MKKIFWTTVFWLVIFFGFSLYMKMFDVNMAATISNRLGTTTVTTSGELIATGATASAGNEVMSGIIVIQTTLADMQIKLDTLVGGITVANALTGPSVIVPDPLVSTGTKTTK